MMGDKGELRDETYTKVDGGHLHVDSRGGNTSEVKHKHYIEKLNAYKMTLKVYNHLQKDDKATCFRSATARSITSLTASRGR